jgi:hypothetical protein
MSKDIDIRFENIYNPIIEKSAGNNKQTESPQKILVNEPISTIIIQPLCFDSICNFLFNLCCCCFLYD